MADSVMPAPQGEPSDQAGSPGPVRTGPRTPGRLSRMAAEARDFLASIYEKAGEDNIFFMAGAIAFNVLVAFVPLALAVLGIAGVLLRLQPTDPTERLVAAIIDNLPPVSPEFAAAVQDMLRGLMDQSTGLLSIGTIILIFVATRLISSLRTALREVFDVQQDRGIIGGKLFDIKMVFAAGTLFAINVGLTIVLDVATRVGGRSLGIGSGEMITLHLLSGRLLALASIWVMFLLIYRYLPARRIHWRTAAVAATFTAVLFELMKFAFSWYVTNIADYGSTYGNLATLVILIFWIYYSAVAFILGGEVAQVAAMRRIRRRQRERLQ